MYTKSVMKHFRNPKNFGKLKNPDGIGKVGNIICGDVMWLYIKVIKNKKSEEVLKDVKFETFGCVAAIATSSIITGLAKGKTLSEALNLSKSTIVDSLGGLPPIKIHCSVLAIDALSEAIYDYLSKRKRKTHPLLLKRHKRIIREKKIIEEKYADWIQKEEFLHNASHD